MPNVSWIGQSLNGRYRIEELLGHGGMSSVYKATDPNLRRPVAVKIIHPHLSNNADFLRRFEEEAAMVAQLRHENIVQVYDFNHDGDVYYMVLEFLPGETLESRLKRLNARKQRVDVADAVRFIAQICDAVDYAHGKGVIHRDIKPANIMLDVYGKAILMDFGIARMVGGQLHTAAGAVIGTALYMSPEQIKGLQVDERTDIYSLGVTLFETISGRPPFEADSAMTLMMMHLNDPIPDIRVLKPPVPESLVTVVARALEKDRDRRYQSAGEMATALRAVLARPAAGPAQGVVPANPVEQAQVELTDHQNQPGTLFPISPPAAASNAPTSDIVSPSGKVPDRSKPAQAAPESITAPPEKTLAASVKEQENSQAEADTPTPEEAGLFSAEPSAAVKSNSVAVNTADTGALVPSGPRQGVATESAGPSGSAASNPAPPTEGPDHPSGAAAVYDAPRASRSRLPLLLGGCAALLVLALVATFLAARPLLARIGAAGTGSQLSPTATSALVQGGITEAEATGTAEAVTPAAEASLTMASEVVALTDTPSPAETQAVVPTGQLYVRIDNITIENNRYVVTYETLGFTEQLPGTNIHFFYNTVPPDQAGVPGKGPWQFFGGPRPFKGYPVNGRPDGATQMCALVANPDHTVLPGSGNCFDLPNP